MRLGNPRWGESIELARKSKDPVPPAPQVVALMRDQRDSGKTYRAIAGHLNELGLRTPKGFAWYAGTIRKAINRSL